MTINCAVVMDPIERITPSKDTTFAMMLAAQARGWVLHYLQLNDIWMADGEVMVRSQRVSVKDDATCWYELDQARTHLLADMDLVLMRKDPPFDMEYIYATYLLELAESKGVKVVNKPQSLRDANEKLFTAWFPQCTPPSLVTRDAAVLRNFIQSHDFTVLKPLHEMGGGSIFKLAPDDANVNVVIETLTQKGQAYMMAQQFIPEIMTQGDKRVIVINGEPMPFALARLPTGGDIRGNLAAGGVGKVVPLTDRDRWICQEVAPVLIEKGLLFVGLDIIGDYLTEINVTSPTCVRQIEAATGLTICDTFLDVLGL